MPAPPVNLPNKNDLFTQYQILEDLGEFPNYSLFRVKAPNGQIKLWKKIDLQFNAASIETRLLPIIEKVYHPNLNTISGSFLFPDKGLLFVESEFPVKTLRHRLEELRSNSQGTKTARGIPISELFSYMAQAAEGIDYLNAPQHPHQGKRIAIYHRALSPDSLHLFEDRGKIICKVGDFGLAKPILDNNDSARHSLGLTNYDYAPPEFDEGMTTSTSDQYSFATTYCELRTGQLPFTGSLLQKLQAQLSGTPDLGLLETNERPVVARALSRDPHARFPSCREFIRQLQMALGGIVTVPISSGSSGNKMSAEPASNGDAGFGKSANGWALSARPVGRTGGSLFNIGNKEPAKPTGKSGDVGSAQPSAPMQVAPLPAVEAKAPPPAKAPENKSFVPKKSAPPPQDDIRKVEAPKAPNEGLVELTTANWVPGKVTGGSSVPKEPVPKESAHKEKEVPKSEVAATSVVPAPVVTPPPPAPAKESMSTKARETLDLIKRRQGGQTAPAPVAKPSSGSKFLDSGTIGQLPPLPAPRVAPPPQARPKGAGALNETPAPPRSSNPGTVHRASTPNMGVALPTRNSAVATPAAQQLPLPASNQLARRNSSGLGKAVRRPSSNPLEAKQNNPTETVKRQNNSWITMLMVTIVAFCVGLILIFYFNKK